MTDNDVITAAHDLFKAFDGTDIKSIEFDLESLTWTIHYHSHGPIALIDSKHLKGFLYNEIKP